MTAIGTFETCRRTLRMSANRGRLEVIGARSERRMVRPCVARGFVKLASAVLHQCIRSLIGAVLLRTIMDISAHAVSLSDRPQWASWVTSVRMRREDRSSISSHPLADLGG